MANSNYLDIRSLYHSNYLNPKFNIRFSCNFHTHILESAVQVN